MNNNGLPAVLEDTSTGRGQCVEAGRHTIQFNVENHASGVYFCKL